MEHSQPLKSAQEKNPVNKYIEAISLKKTFEKNIDQANAGEAAALEGILFESKLVSFADDGLVNSTIKCNS